MLWRVLNNLNLRWRSAMPQCMHSSIKMLCIWDLPAIRHYLTCSLWKVKIHPDLPLSQWYKYWQYELPQIIKLCCIASWKTCVIQVDKAHQYIYCRALVPEKCKNHTPGSCFMNDLPYGGVHGGYHLRNTPLAFLISPYNMNNKVYPKSQNGLRNSHENLLYILVYNKYWHTFRVE